MNIVANASDRKLTASAELPWITDAIAKLQSELVAHYGDAQRERAARGLKQVSEYWRPEDGDALVFQEFVKANFAGDQGTLDTMFHRFEHLLEQYSGHSQEIAREFRTQSDLDLGPILPFDEIFAGYDPSAHFLDDSFQNKLAFVVLLNFPLTTLEERLKQGEHWSRRQWAEARLAQQFSKRIPAEVNLAIAQAASDGERYISQYNIWMHHVLDDQGARLFPSGMRLLSHWNLRDEIKASYADSQNGLAKQRIIQRVMERIINQEIPAAVVNNPAVDWNPFRNKITPAATEIEPREDAIGQSTPAATNEAEPDTRYFARSFSFARGETIHTENSYKYTPAMLASLFRNAGMVSCRSWSDERHWFELHLLAPEKSSSIS